MNRQKCKPLLAIRFSASLSFSCSSTSLRYCATLRVTHLALNRNRINQLTIQQKSPSCSARLTSQTIDPKFLPFLRGKLINLTWRSLGWNSSTHLEVWYVKFAWWSDCLDWSVQLVPWLLGRLVAWYWNQPKVFRIRHIFLFYNILVY